MSSSRKRRLTRLEATAAEIAEMMRSQAPITQADIPPHMNVYATMEAAWQDLIERAFHRKLNDELMGDGKFIFYHGVQAAVNLCIFCIAQQHAEAAIDQIVSEIIAYEDEAVRLMKERLVVLDDEPPVATVN